MITSGSFAYCLQPSFRKLTVRLLTFSASAVVLAPAFRFVCCRTLASLSATSFVACLNCGFSRCNRPGFFNGLVLLNCSPYQQRFLDNLHLVFQLGSFSVPLWLSSPSSVSEYPRTDVIHSTPSARTWVFTLVVSVDVDTSYSRACC